jgi:hypothetical protein
VFFVLGRIVVVDLRTSILLFSLLLCLLKKLLVSAPVLFGGFMNLTLEVTLLISLVCIVIQVKPFRYFVWQDRAVH